jgi:ubiquinone biosynthesis protein
MSPLQFTRSVRSLNRLRHIAVVLTRHGFGHIVAQINLSRFVPVWMIPRRATRSALGDAEAPTVARRVRQVCTDLGPTFVKLGQVMSSRPDILPADLLTELRKLQDNVPPFENTTAMEVISRSLGRPVQECFAWISDQPLASASIGQAYRARSHDGRDLIVKVRRPGIAETIALDMQLLAMLAESVERFMPELGMYRPAMLVDELDQTLRRELDYVNEASVTCRFHEYFADTIGVRVPAVFWELTAPEVLTLEAVPGTNVETVLRTLAEDHRPIDRRLIARRLAECFLDQVFELGVFHADPHPGNVLVHPPATLGLVDFGQVGRITHEFMTELIALLYSVVHGEMDVAVETVADMGAIGRDTDRRSLHRALLILHDKYYGLPIKRLNVTKLLEEYSDIMRRHDVVLPRDVALLIKATGTVGALAAQLDPELNLFELLGPRVDRAMKKRFDPAEVTRATSRVAWDVLSILRRAPGQVRGLLRRLSTTGWELHVRHENIDRLVRELDRSSNRLAFSVVIGAIIIGSSVVFSANTQMALFGIKIQYFGVVGYLVAGILGLGLAWAIFRSGRLH